MGKYKKMVELKGGPASGRMVTAVFRDGYPPPYVEVLTAKLLPVTDMYLEVNRSYEISRYIPVMFRDSYKEWWEFYWDEHEIHKKGEV